MKHPKHAHPSAKKYVVITLGALLLLGQLLFNFYVFATLDGNRMIADYQAQSDFTRLTAQVNDNLYRQPSFNAEDDRLYLPEVRASLPLTEATEQIKYTGNSEQNGDFQLQLSSVAGEVLGFDSLNCVQMVRLSSEPVATGGEITAGTVAFDGRQLSIFKADAADCGRYYTATEVDGLVRAVRQMRAF